MQVTKTNSERREERKQRGEEEINTITPKTQREEGGILLIEIS